LQITRMLDEQTNGGGYRPFQDPYFTANSRAPRRPSPQPPMNYNTGFPTPTSNGPSFARSSVPSPLPSAIAAAPIPQYPSYGMSWRHMWVLLLLWCDMTIRTILMIVAQIAPVSSELQHGPRELQLHWQEDALSDDNSSGTGDKISSAFTRLADRSNSTLRLPG